MANDADQAGGVVAGGDEAAFLDPEGAEAYRQAVWRAVVEMNSLASETQRFLNTLRKYLPPSDSPESQDHDSRLPGYPLDRALRKVCDVAYSVACSIHRIETGPGLGWWSDLSEDARMVFDWDRSLLGDLKARWGSEAFWTIPTYDDASDDDDIVDLDCRIKRPYPDLERVSITTAELAALDRLAAELSRATEAAAWTAFSHADLPPDSDDPTRFPYPWLPFQLRALWMDFRSGSDAIAAHEAAPPEAPASPPVDVVGIGNIPEREQVSGADAGPYRSVCLNNSGLPTSEESAFLEAIGSPQNGATRRQLIERYRGKQGADPSPRTLSAYLPKMQKKGWVESDGRKPARYALTPAGLRALEAGRQSVDDL